MGQPWQRTVLALLREKPVDMGSGVPGPCGDDVELLSLWVAAGARGQGVGDRLFRAVAEWALREGAQTMRLRVRSDNAHAIALYRRHRFEDTGQAGDPPPRRARRTCHGQAAVDHLSQLSRQLVT